MVNLSIKDLRELCKKDYYDAHVQRLHYFLLYFTRYLLRTNITPNQITTFWIFLQLFASFLMIYGVYYLNVLGIILYTLAMFLDGIDGQIARIKKINSYKGIFLEWMGVYFGSPIFFLCFSIGVSIAYNNTIYVVFGVISALALLYSKLVLVNPYEYHPEFRENVISLRNSLSMRKKKKKFALLYLLLRRSNPFNILFLGIIFNQPRPTLIIYTAFYVLEFGRRLYSQLKALHQLDKELNTKP